MCGLVGFTHPDAMAVQTLARMLAPITHRGPDQSGTHVDSGIALGHHRLIIISHDGGRQPRVDAASGDALVFNGEIYEFQRHAEALRADGVILRDGSDTEVLFQMVRRLGVEQTLERIDGMFAFAYRDGATGRVWLVRDRFGEKPLFWGLTADGALVFGSELRAVRRHPAFAAAGFDAAAFDQFLSFDYVPAPRSGVLGISKLRPAHMLLWDNGRVSETSWWRPVFAPAPRGGSSPVDELEALLVHSIKNRLVADVPVGVFLSGGIDSSLVAALACGISPHLKAFTIRLGSGSYDETPYAAEVARLFGLEHVVADLGDGDVLDAWKAVDNHLDEPFADSSILPTWLLCREARRHVTVALGGDGADELFAGYPNFPVRRFAPLMAACPRWMAAAARGCLSLLPTSDKYMGLEFKLRQLFQGLGHAADRQPFLWLSPFAEAERQALTTPEFRHAIAGRDGMSPVADVLESSSGRTGLERLQHLFLSLYLPDDILTKVDRASMYNSLEVRAPFLDRDLAEFALKLPFRWKLDGMCTKKILKDVARRHLPAHLVDRKKHGFALPVAEMLRGPLAEPLRDSILSSSNPVAGWFHRPALEWLIGEHMSGQRDHRKKLWALFQLFTFAKRDV